MGTATKKQNKVPTLRFKSFNKEWERERIDSITSDVTYGLTIRPDYLTEGVPLISAREIKIGKIQYDTAPKISLTDFNKLSDKAKPRLGDLFLTKTGTIGFSAIVDKDIKAAITQNIAIIRIKDSRRIYGPFLLYQFKTANFQQTILSKVNQSTIMDLQLGDIKKTKVSVPEYAEQQKIADFLGSVDDWLDNLRQQKTALETYKRGMMQKLFTQQVRFKDDNGNDFPEWKECSFEEILTSVSIRGHQVNRDDFLDSGEFPVVDQGKDFIAGYTNSNDVVLDDVPVIVFGDHTTIVKYVDFKFAAGADGTKVLRRKRGDNPKLLYYLMLANPLEAEGYKRHFSILRQKNYLLPTSNAEQQKIADFLTTIDQTIADKKEEITKVQDWKKGLMQKMFI